MRVLGRWLLWSAIALGVLVGVLRATAIRWWQIPAEDPYLDASLAPSFRGGDWILLWRLTPPTIGNLAVCPEPKHPERITIARMVAEERQTVHVEGTNVTVNDKPFTYEGDCVEERFKITPPQGGAEVEEHCKLEVAGGVIHMRGDADGTADAAALDLTLKEGEVALVSDNRRYPYDSRDYGPVERKTCKEIPFFRLVGAGGFFDTARRFQYVR
ncbi:MAG TPA: S26 family signal peptidase [Polyangiaceae bacterium]|nr:S26 family signal peptidase [Polyangiaceae bacterium]